MLSERFAGRNVYSFSSLRIRFRPIPSIIFPLHKSNRNVSFCHDDLAAVITSTLFIQQIDEDTFTTGCAAPVKVRLVGFAHGVSSLSNYFLGSGGSPLVLETTERWQPYDFPTTQMILSPSYSPCAGYVNWIIFTSRLDRSLSLFLLRSRNRNTLHSNRDPNKSRTPRRVVGRITSFGNYLLTLSDRGA